MSAKERFGFGKKEAKKRLDDTEWKRVLSEQLAAISRNIKNVTMFSMWQVVREAFSVDAEWDDTCDGVQKELRDKKCYLLYAGANFIPRESETYVFSYVILDGLARTKLVTFRETNLGVDLQHPDGHFMIHDYLMRRVSLGDLLRACQYDYRALFTRLYEARRDSSDRRIELLKEALLEEEEALEKGIELVERGAYFDQQYFTPGNSRLKRIEKVLGALTFW